MYMQQGVHAGRTAPAGSTLVEAMVATTIMAIVIALALQMTTVSSQSISEKLSIAGLEVKGERTIKLITESLVQSSQVLNDTTDYDSLSYYTPMESKYSGLVRGTGASTVEGYVATELIYGDVKTFSYSAEVTLSEANQQLDLNADGDQNDTFNLGYIDLEDSADGTHTIVGVNNIVQTNPNHGGSVLQLTADDTTGRLFFLPDNSTLIEINLYLITVSRDRTAHMAHCQGQVFLRNQGHYYTGAE